MKRLAIQAVFLASLSLLLASCPTPFDLDAKNLAGQTLSYSGPNGRDLDVFAFGPDGKTGTWERRRFAFDFATPEAAASGTFEDKSWFQDAGFISDIVFDPETHDILITDRQVFGRSGTARAAGTAYASDFSYMDLVEHYSLEDDAAYESYSVTTSTKAVFNQDNASLVTQLLMQETGVEGPLVLFGDDGVHWSIPSVENRSYSVGGVVTTKVLDLSMTATIGEDAISNEFFLTLTQTTGTASPTAAHMVNRGDYAVNGYYRVGSSDPGASFDDVWKEGNTVTFYATNRSTEDICYTGEEPPSAPTAFDEYGYGENAIDANNYYRVDKAPAGIFISFERKRGYIANSQFLSFASRGKR